MSEITIFGDSVMQGVVLEDGKYTARAGERQSLEESCGIAADNCAKFGATVEKGLSFAEKRIRRGPLMPYTLIEFGGNDSDFLWAEIAREPEAEHQCKTPPERFIAVFYAGLGASLLLAGMLFGKNYLLALRQSAGRKE